tara:strand:- start:1677 stop:2306 length:630 start_codon:yes stop_codon:yes gene_type:complete
MILVKKSSLTFLSHENDLNSHRTRIALSEKSVSVELQFIDLDNPPEDFLDINPYHSLPVLIDRNLVLNHANIIMEYLDERFPHPPLLPVYPVARAKTRIMIHRIEQDFYQLAEKILAEEDVDKSREKLTAQLVKLAPAFSEMPYFLSQEFTLVDCSLSALLWRLPQLGIELPKSASAVEEYAERMFEREAFKQSLTEAEKELREDHYDV